MEHGALDTRLGVGVMILDAVQQLAQAPVAVSLHGQELVGRGAGVDWSGRKMMLGPPGVCAPGTQLGPGSDTPSRVCHAGPVDPLFGEPCTRDHASSAPTLPLSAGAA